MGIDDQRMAIEVLVLEFLDHQRAGTRVSAPVDVAARIGTSSLSHESVPTAFAVLKATGGNVWNAAVASANLGGDTDTIGAIAAGMAGAISGYASIPEARTAVLFDANALNLEETASSLLRIRDARMNGGNEGFAIAHA